LIRSRSDRGGVASIGDQCQGELGLERPAGVGRNTRVRAHVRVTDCGDGELGLARPAHDLDLPRHRGQLLLPGGQVVPGHFRWWLNFGEKEMMVNFLVENAIFKINVVKVS
jgi:hypothetical protein